jgi:flagellar motor protein MotB
MILLLVFFIFVQFVANSKVIARLMVEMRQRQVAASVLAALGDDASYLEVITDGNLQRLRFSDAILFDKGSDSLKSTGERVLSAVAGGLKQYGSYYHEIQIEGHTDNDPIRTPQFASNWELSSARATAVVRHLQDQADFNPNVFPIAATGRSEYVPVDGNPNIKARNRRIEIVLAYYEKDLNL